MKLSPGRLRLLVAVLSNLTDRDVDKAFERGGISPDLKIEFLRIVWKLGRAAERAPRR